MEQINQGSLYRVNRTGWFISGKIVYLSQHALAEDNVGVGQVHEGLEQDLDYNLQPDKKIYQN